MTIVRRFVIYGLSDPRTNELRYIGKSIRGLARAAQHWYPSRQRRRTHKENWIASVLAAGLTPHAFIIEEHETAAALDEAERYLIALLRCMGAPLTNATPGGDGWAVGDLNPMRDPAARARFSAANKGRKFVGAHKQNQAASTRRPEVLAANAAATRARWQDPEYRAKMKAMAAAENAKRWSDPEYSARVKASIAAANRRRAKKAA